MSKSVQFGRAKQSPVQRWAFFITFAMWCLFIWLLDERPEMMVTGVVIAAIAYWGGKDLDHAAWVEKGRATLRDGHEENVVDADEVTDIRIEETPGWLSRSVYMRIDRGRFDSFDIPRAKAPKTPEGRQRLQTKVDEAMTLLRGAEPEV